MSKQLKKLVNRDLERRFENLDGYVLVDFRGLDSAQSFDLRRTLNGAGIRMSVVPNRLAVRVLDRWKGQRPEFREFFRGPTALVYGRDGAVSASKAVVGWRRKHKDLLSIKGGVLGAQIMPPALVESLSRAPDREQLLSQVAGAFLAPLSRLASVTQGPLRKLAYALDAYRRKREEEGAGGGAPSGSEEAVSPAAPAAPGA